MCAEKSKKPEFGDLDIYFGCREMRRDNLYAEERALAKAEGIISSNNTAFSREANIPKVRVFCLQIKMLIIFSKW